MVKKVYFNVQPNKYNDTRLQFYINMRCILTNLLKDHMKLFRFYLFFYCTAMSVSALELKTYPAPKGAKMNTDFTVTVNGNPIDVYRAAVRRTEKRFISMAYFDFSGEVTVEITAKVTIKKLAIRPLRAGIKAKRKEKSFRFKLKEPGNFSIEINNELDRWNLLLFANPIEINIPSKKDPKVIYFGPGLHKIGDGTGNPDNRITISKPGTTVYIAGGAVVQGAIFADGVKNITIRGRGILEGVLMEHDRKKKRYRCMEFRNVAGLNIDGIILQDAPHHGLMMVSCSKIEISNFHNVSYNSNSDGINPISCRDMVIRNTFVRTVDDGIAIKNGKFGAKGSTENLLIEDCVFWNDDWGNGIEIGFETTKGAVMKNIIFRRVDIIHSRSASGEAITIHNGDAADIHNILFEDVVIEDLKGSNGAIEFFIQKTKYSKDKTRGKIRNIRFVRVAWPNHKRSRIEGFDKSHKISNISFEDCTSSGKSIKNKADARIDTNKFVEGLTFK